MRMRLLIGGCVMTERVLCSHAQQLMQRNNVGPGAQQKAAAGRWGLTTSGRAWAAREEGKPLSAEDLNDEFCRICLQGVSNA